MIQVFQSFKNLFFPAEVNPLIAQLDELEKIPVLFEKDRKDNRFDSVLSLPMDPDDEQLQLKRVALLYRLESWNGGLDAGPVDGESVDFLYKEAVGWKRSHPLIGQAILSAKDLMHLKKAAQYSEFIHLLKKFSLLKNKFLNWVLQDGNDVIPFIEFPAAIEHIMDSKLSGRINRHLRILKEGNAKLLCLPFEGMYLSILDEDLTVTFRGNYTLTLREIFHIFSEKEVAVGNLEFMSEGIVNWNLHRLGYWNADLKRYITVDMNLDKWWEEMPVLENLNRRQLVKRFKVDVKSHGWVAAAVATRANPDLDFDATHAFLEVAIPLEDGTYNIYDFGKLATEYPANLMERLMMLTKTVHAAVAYPDDSIFYTTRQRGFEPFLLSSRQGRSLMDLIRRDINIAKQNNLVYQIESENCAKWVHSMLAKVLEEKNVPDLFRMQLLDTHPKGPVAHIFAWIKKLPDSWQVPVLTFLHLPLGAGRTIYVEEAGEKVAKSLSRHSFFETGQIFLPALLIHKVMTGNTVSRASKFFVKFKRNFAARFHFSFTPRLNVFSSLQYTERISKFDNFETGPRIVPSRLQRCLI